MLEQNRPIHEFTGVARFHAAGYTGSRARAATICTAPAST